MKVAVIIFPGSNCDHDAVHTYSSLLSQDVNEIWYKETDLAKPDLVVIPGGFSFGDYLRAGAFARVAPIMKEVARFAEQGGPVIGICNGFQILCEVGLLPGALLQNIERRFLSRFVSLKVENAKTPFSSSMKLGDVFTCPIAHNEGNFFADEETIKELESEGRVVFRYCDADGEVNHDSREINPNGSINSIAGITSSKGNVVGLMPHPERAAESLVGHTGKSSGLSVMSGPLEISI
ncbi:MAG: phosphoribosylformylglycinamidine synthase subunit PurQ [Bdellovibrionales bacterium]|nr:phosphoribosylformylglycinamidine synthase subunit PurQ [Bdellovibrionales bacterium]